MYFEFLAAIIVGILSGVITGLTPGLHVNLVTLIVISSLNLHPLITAVYLFSLGITHTFLDAIPAVFLGAPDEDLALLPGHELFVKGAGHEAVKLTVIGSFFTMLLGIFLMPLMIFFALAVYSFLRPFIAFLLIALMLVLFFKSRSFFSLFTFIISGIFGFVVLNSSLDHKMLPLFSGLFAMSTLFSSLIFPPKIIGQQVTNIVQLKSRNFLGVIFGSSLAGLITSIFPGLSPAQSTALVQPYFSKNKFTYLIFTGGVNTIDFFISLTTLFVLDKARNGALIGIKKIMMFINTEQLIALACVGVFAGCISVILTLKISRFAVFFVNKINFQKISIFILLFLFLLNLYFSGWLGFLVLITCTIIGLIPILSKTPRSFSMGILILPVIINLV